MRTDSFKVRQWAPHDVMAPAVDDNNSCRTPYRLYCNYYAGWYMSSGRISIINSMDPCFSGLPEHTGQAWDIAPSLMPAANVGKTASAESGVVE